MAQYPDWPQGSPAGTQARQPADALARRLSQIFHPILMNLASFLIVGFAAPDARAAGIAWTLICGLAMIVPPTLFYYIRQRQGVYSDKDVSIRQQRNELYLVGFIWVLIASSGLALLGAPRPFLALMICALALGLIGGLINLFWKISAHGTAIASAATVGLLYWQPLGWLLWLCALAVGWARVRTHNHTPLQVLAGMGSATLVVLLAFGAIS